MAFLLPLRDACSGVAEPKSWEKCPNPRARRGDSPGGLLSPVPSHSLLKAGLLQFSLTVDRAALPKNCSVYARQKKAEAKLTLQAGTGHAQVCRQGGDRGCKSLCCRDKPDGSIETELSPSHIFRDDCQREPGDARGARSNPASPRAHPTHAKRDTVRGKPSRSKPILPSEQNCFHSFTPALPSLSVFCLINYRARMIFSFFFF